jgi:hypothetical protein
MAQIRITELSAQIRPVSQVMQAVSSWTRRAPKHGETLRLSPHQGSLISCVVIVVFFDKM